MTRNQIIAESRAALKCGGITGTAAEAIHHGLRIAACREMSGKIASAKGCMSAADDMAELIHREHSDREHGLATMVSRREWASLWIVARWIAYPHFR